MIYYNGGNTQTSTQNSLTNKPLLIKHFIILALRGLFNLEEGDFCLISFFYYF